MTEVYVVPNSPESKPQVLGAVQARVAALQKPFPGVTLEDRGTELRLNIPKALRTDHEAHFGEVATRFLGYLRDRKTLPAWERPNMLAKYLRHHDGNGIEPPTTRQARSAHRTQIDVTIW